jgi:hypothetical protein
LLLANMHHKNLNVAQIAIRYVIRPITLDITVITV